jgi:hypothetical protein
LTVGEFVGVKSDEKSSQSLIHVAVGERILTAMLIIY